MVEERRDWPTRWMARFPEFPDRPWLIGEFDDDDLELVLDSYRNGSVPVELEELVPAAKLKEQEERCERLEEALREIQGEAYLWGQGEPEGRTCGDCLGHCLRVAHAALQHSRGEEG